MTDSFSNVGTTLTGGIQDISALLPLIGTEQCERHVGSCLKGGYVYAAATPLSIFGCLGIVKTGLSILIASISIPMPSFSFTPFPRVSFKPSRQHWLGARLLDNAGFKPIGTVAPMIGMDGKRYGAEARIVDILQDKHIDNPINLAIRPQSLAWNIGLIFCTVLGAAISVVPYIPLISKGLKNDVHFPWTFPILRTAGSCFAVICCQMLIQLRIISLMKNRVIFIAMNRFLVEDLKSQGFHDAEYRLQHQNEFRWDANLPAEECLWSLKNYLRSHTSVSPVVSPSLTYNSSEKDEQPYSPGISPVVPGLGRTIPDVQPHVTLAMTPLSDPQGILRLLNEQKQFYFTAPRRHFIFIVLSWMLLLLSIPATVAGYIGCFTLVTSSTKTSGSLTWLGLEAALSVLRILLWASNPKFDEKTNITGEIKLSEYPPLVTTVKDIDSFGEPGNTLDLVPERTFLEQITSYTGPLEQFDKPENTVLYFTLSGDSPNKGGKKCLFMTVFDVGKRTAFTLYRDGDSLVYKDSLVTCNAMTGEMQAEFQAHIGESHPRRKDHAELMNRLTKYYNLLLHAVYGPPKVDYRRPLKTAVLRWGWELDQTQANISYHTINLRGVPPPLGLTEDDHLYLQRGYEHKLKTMLIKNWSEWLITSMAAIRNTTRNDIRSMSTDKTPEEKNWGLTEVDTQLVWEWVNRELKLLQSSMKLENLLQLRMKDYIEIARRRGDSKLLEWVWAEFGFGQRKRLEQEKGQARKRMEEAKVASTKEAEEEGRPYDTRKWFDNVEERWQAGMTFIDSKWTEAIEGKTSALENGSSELKNLVKEKTMKVRYLVGDEYKRRYFVLKELKPRFEDWNSPRENEAREMEATIERIRYATFEDLGRAYEYPRPSSRLANVIHSRFADLRYLLQEEMALVARFCSATVYDVFGCNPEVVRDVIRKSTTRSVINVGEMVKDVPVNDHLFYMRWLLRDQEDPAFVQHNRERWWQQAEQQSVNSWIYYLTPRLIDRGGQYAFTSSGTIARIMVCIRTPASLRLRLVHCREGKISVSIQKDGAELRALDCEEIPHGEPRLQRVDLGMFEEGKHELELVMDGGMERYYGLREIMADFIVERQISAAEAVTSQVLDTWENTDTAPDTSTRIPLGNEKSQDHDESQSQPPTAS